MKTNIRYPKIPLAQSIIALCKANNVCDIVISPGSRNAPLTLGFVGKPNFNCYSIADERCAAFFALGMAQQLQKPVALVCTSGSALLNYYPAVAEAFYSQIPLVIISADRPKNKIDIGDGQTIRQENVFANHILFSANLTEEVSAENNFKIGKAMHIALNQKGPVHINAPFEEPLYETVSEPTVHSEVFNFEENIVALPLVEDYLKKWNTSSKKLVLVGENFPDVIANQWIEILANDPSVVVMTEVNSNLHHPNFIHPIDSIITPFSEEDFKAFQPDILLTFGGMIVSKRIKAFLRKFTPKAHWHVDEQRAYNTFGCLTQHFKTSPNRFFAEFLPKTQTVESDYLQNALQIKAFRENKGQHYLQNIPFSDLKVFQTILPMLPHNSQLQVSNSSPIRYAQLFQVHPSIEVFCNRGTSGIDGSTSTAIGAALASEKPTVLITGDVSFFYDSNALWNNYIPNSFKIIVINNGGGGIFRILPGHEQTPVFTTFFETSHQLRANHLAAMFGFNYACAHNEAELKKEMHFIMTSPQKAILEVCTPTEVNDKVLLDYFKNLN